MFHISAQNIELPPGDGSYEYPQSMFLADIRKTMYTPVNPSFTIFLMEKWKQIFQNVICYNCDWRIKGDVYRALQKDITCYNLCIDPLHKDITCYNLCIDTLHNDITCKLKVFAPFSKGDQSDKNKQSFPNRWILLKIFFRCSPLLGKEVKALQLEWSTLEMFLWTFLCFFCFAHNKLAR